MTPELLPMITTVTLSRGAMRMAKRKVIVKRLASIRDLGATTVLCTDKTGTLTSAEISLARSVGPTGVEDDRPSRLGAIAASLGGDRGALDTTLIAGVADAAKGWTPIARHAFDFNRRMGSVLVNGPDGRLLIAKGAPEEIVSRCASSRAGAQILSMGADDRTAVLERVRALAQEGLRAVAVASRAWSDDKTEVTFADEMGLTFEGLCAFADPPKATAAGAIARL